MNAGHTDIDAPEALRRVADGLGQSVLIRDSAFARVAEAGGPLTSSDRARRAFDVWFKATTAVERHARTIGLKRIPRDKPATFADLVTRGRRPRLYRRVS